MEHLTPDERRSLGTGRSYTVAYWRERAEELARKLNEARAENERLRDLSRAAADGGVVWSKRPVWLCAYCCVEQPPDIERADAEEEHLPDCPILMLRAALERKET